MTPEEKKALKEKVIEELNKVAILMNDVDDYPEYPETGNHREDDKIYQQNRELCLLKKIVTELAEQNPYSDVMEYYSSYCF